MQSKTDIVIDRAVGARIKNLRLRKKLSQTALGEQIGVTFQQIQKYENGKNRVSASCLAQLARVFGIPVGAFYSEVPTRDTKPVRRTKAGTDTGVDRLVKAYQILKKQSLKAAVLQVTEEMARLQRSKAPGGGSR